MSLAEVAGLTDYQISRVYFHKRDKEGAIVFPEMPTEASKDPIKDAFKALEAMKSVMRPEKYREARDKLLAKRSANGG